MVHKYKNHLKGDERGCRDGKLLKQDITASAMVVNDHM